MLTVVFMGLEECLIGLLVNNHGESGEEQNLGLKIISYIR